MSFLIKNVQVRMSRIGLHSDKLPQPKVMYAPTVTVVTYEAPKEKRRMLINELLGRHKKSDYIGKVICGKFFILLFKTEWAIISPECKLTASMSPCGEIIRAEEAYFVVKTGNVITSYNIEGKSIGSRELTDKGIQDLIKKSAMRQTIIMTVETWSCETNIGEIRAILDGGSCRINWGDGVDLPYEPNGQELHAQHTYPEKSAEEEYVIKIYSDERNIIGIYANCGDLWVKDIDISRCQTLKYFNLSSCSVEHFDLKTNPGITKVDIEGDLSGIADFSNSLDLKELSINFSFACSETYYLYNLDLSNCSKLEKFKCTCIMEPISIKLPKYFPLKEFIFDESSSNYFTKRQLKKITEIVERNGGKILIEHMLRKLPHNEFFLQPDEQGNKCRYMGNQMQEQIKMDISPSRFQYTAYIAILLDGDSCEIDWGDGHKSKLDAKRREWQYGVHVYSQSIPRQVLVTSGAGNIIGMFAGNFLLCNGVEVNDIDISECRSLRYFAAHSISHLNVNTNPGIRIIDLPYCGSADFPGWWSRDFRNIAWQA